MPSRLWPRPVECCPSVEMGPNVVDLGNVAKMGVRHDIVRTRARIRPKSGGSWPDDGEIWLASVELAGDLVGVGAQIRPASRSTSVRRDPRNFGRCQPLIGKIVRCKLMCVFVGGSLVSVPDSRKLVSSKCGVSVEVMSNSSRINVEIVSGSCRVSVDLVLNWCRISVELVIECCRKSA